MKRTLIVWVAAAWVVSLAGVGLWASQVRLGIRVVQSQVISGADFGFQAAGQPDAANGFVAGHLVVKIDGKWIEARIAEK